MAFSTKFSRVSALIKMTDQFRVQTCRYSLTNFQKRLQMNKLVSNNLKLQMQTHKHNISRWICTANLDDGKKEICSKAFKVIIGLGIALLVSVKTHFSATNCEESKLEDERKSKLQEAILKARDLLERIKDETGSPGIVIGVSVNGKTIWTEGMGYADVENRIPCTPDTVLRIASISKSIAMGMVAKLWENGDLDFDKPIQHYLPKFPVKYFEGQKVDITTRQLVSHLAGIRHYDKDYMKKNVQNKSNDENVKGLEKDKEGKIAVKSMEDNPQKTNSENTKEPEKPKSEFELKEYYIKKHYKSITDSLTLFQDDPLVHKPGDKFLYTSHGWTLVSAVMEKAANKPFDKLMMDYFRCLGLQHTFLEHNDPLVYHRGRHYVKNKRGRIINAPYVDNSYKWAGGGFISNVTDLLKFGNIMLYSYQQESTSNETGSITKGDNQNTSEKRDNTNTSEKGDNQNTSEKRDNTNTSEKGGNTNTSEKGDNSENKPLPGYLRKETMKMIFKPVDKTKCSWDLDGSYGMGWAVVPEKYENGLCKFQRHYVSHTGGAIGCSSVLLILPSKQLENVADVEYGKPSGPPHGVIVTIIANISSVNLNTVSLEIAKLFESAFNI